MGPVAPVHCILEQIYQFIRLMFCFDVLGSVGKILIAQKCLVIKAPQIRLAIDMSINKNNRCQYIVCYVCINVVRCGT